MTTVLANGLRKAALTLGKAILEEGPQELSNAAESVAADFKKTFPEIDGITRGELLGHFAVFLDDLANESRAQNTPVDDNWVHGVSTAFAAAGVTSMLEAEGM